MSTWADFSLISIYGENNQLKGGHFFMFITEKKVYGIEKQGKTFAVVDYSKTVKTFSKVLTKKEEKELEVTGRLPEGITAKEHYAIVAQFATRKLAEQFIKANKDKVGDSTYGIFKSRAQYQLAKKLLF